jgi:hypothetical protein
VQQSLGLLCNLLMHGMCLMRAHRFCRFPWTARCLTSATSRPCAGVLLWPQVLTRWLQRQNCQSGGVAACAQRVHANRRQSWAVAAALVAAAAVVAAERHAVQTNHLHTADVLMWQPLPRHSQDSCCCRRHGHLSNCIFGRPCAQHGSSLRLDVAGLNGRNNSTENSLERLLPPS